MLRLHAVTAGYQGSQVLFGIDLAVDAGEAVTLLGRNGMGKTTTVRALTGLNPPSGGTVEFLGQPVAGWPAFRIARLGLGLVPEGRRIFPTLTVRENLLATAANRSGAARPWNVEGVLALFPGLADRLDQSGRTLSGGEQQMLAIGRALMTNPHLLVLDEAAEGLAPRVRADIWAALARLKSEGQALLVIDQNLQALLELGDRHYIMEKGRIAWSGSSEALRAAPSLGHRYLGVD